MKRLSLPRENKNTIEAVKSNRNIQFCQAKTLQQRNVNIKNKSSFNNVLRDFIPLFTLVLLSSIRFIRDIENG